MKIYEKITRHKWCLVICYNNVKKEESYTSVSSFYDLDIMPKYEASDKKEYKFSGKRIKRGLY